MYVEYSESYLARIKGWGRQFLGEKLTVYVVMIYEKGVHY